MTYLNEFSLRNLQFYITSPHSCSYLEGKQARSQVAVPNHLIDTQVYSELIKLGFRRSGLYTYRPHCDKCRACVPVRLIADQFVPNRTQRRTAKRLKHLTAEFCNLEFNAEHYQLYRKYQASRHAGGGMDQDNREQFTNFLLQSNIDTMLVAFREAGELRMVSLIDRLGDGLSSVYTFFDPDLTQASFGTYNILWQAELCNKLGLPYVYLGYWIAESRKMSYKINFQPLEGYRNGDWHLLPPQT
ncbi:arginyltransferase [Sulfurirhabdus autotrophica]|uniref:Aspartate/glutamate leucyltransferase n=1 Tax=Sulfurirhabdus autotrophica TaxID=1706046 RepID=A0A4R3Y5B4_9PROT|nr:arginyltransferase [Sulfurirhabdus autotrophica]TCV87435.1 arginine-tRNA-protein transferase [Sulfurirhabdus autotrophica]